MTNPFINADGLELRFGNEQAKVAEGGKISTRSDEQELVINIVGVDVPTVDAPVEKHVGLPQGAYLVSADLVVTTAFTSGGSATLDLGLMIDDGDGTYSTFDDDGIDAAIAVAALTADAVIATNGALIGTVLATQASVRPYVVSSGFNTAAFTAGEANLHIKYRVLSA